MSDKQQDPPIICGLCNRSKKQLDELKVPVIQGGQQDDGTIPVICGGCVTRERNKLIEEGIING